MEIAYVILLDGELYNYTRRLQTNLSRLVNTKQALQLEPHITVKYGFEIKDISPFEKYFDQLVNSIHPFTIRLNKINYFEPNVAFLDIEKNKVENKTNKKYADTATVPPCAKCTKRLVE